MNLDFLEFSPAVMFRLGAVAAVTVLRVLLVASFVSRSRVFCEYLRHMTGIELKLARTLVAMNTIKLTQQIST